MAVHPADRLRSEAPGVRAGSRHARLPGQERRAPDGLLRRFTARRRREGRPRGHGRAGSGRPGRPGGGAFTRVRRPRRSARRSPGRRRCRDVLLGHEQHRHRDWRGERRRCRCSRHLRPALLPGSHGHPCGARHRRRARHGERDGGRSVHRRHVRHLDADAVAGLAIHRGRRLLRGADGRGHPRDGGRPHAGPAALQERADGDLHRWQLLRRALDQGRAHGGHLGPGRDHQPGGQRADGDQLRERGVPPCSDVRRAPRQREEVLRARRDLRGPGVLPWPALRRHRGDARDQGRVRDGRAEGDA